MLVLSLYQELGDTDGGRRLSTRWENVSRFRWDPLNAAHDAIRRLIAIDQERTTGQTINIGSSNDDAATNLADTALVKVRLVDR